jgi:Tol biopolymer transport system component/DNA-binding winged helix-turn-helix (wHTH) protein
MPPPPGDDGGVRFGVFELDVRARELRRQGRRVHLQDKPFELLVLLASRPGELVTRDELQRHLWPGGTFVVFDDNLNAAVRKAREALGDSAEAPRFIETVPRHGYRFVASVARPDPRPDHALQASDAPAASADAGGPPRTARRSTSLAVALAAGLAILLGTGYTVTRPSTSPPTDPVVRFRITPPPQTHFPPGGPRLAVSPDGKRAAFVAHTEAAVGRRIWIQSLDSPSPRPVAGTEEAFDVFWSPDSRAIAFVAVGMLRRLDLDRGTAVPLGPADGSSGGAWSEAAGLLVTSVEYAGLVLFPPGGGPPVAVTTLDATREERVHRFPQFMPDGRSFIYVAQSRRPELSAVYLARVGEPGRTRLLDTPYKAELVAPDVLLFVRHNRLLAQQVDLMGRTLVGEAMELASDVFTSDTGEAWYSSSPTGVFAHVGAPPPVGHDLDWYARDGRRLPRLAVPARCVNVALSPDDRRAALECRTAEAAAPDVWLAQLDEGRVTRATSHHANDESPVWSPDGRFLAYARHRGLREEADTYVMDVSSPGEGRALLSADGHSEHATSWSAGAGVMLFEQEGNVGKQDLWVLPLAAGARPRPWLATPASEHRAVISPDGQWVAYQSDRTGRPEVYVRPLESPETGEWTISTHGGRAPRWQRAGRELYFVSEDWQVMAAAPGPDGGWAGITPRVLFELPGRLPAPAVPPAFDVTADGSRFLVAAPPNPSGDPPVTVVVNRRPRG